MADEKNICARCRKVENSIEKFELVFDENAYFRHLCPDCYLEWLVEQIDDEQIKERLYKELESIE